MDKNYTIEWHNETKSVLEIKYWGDAVLKDILESNVEAISVVAAAPNEVIVIHNSNGYNVDLELLGVGKIHDSVYSKFPPIPANLKMVVIILGNRFTRSVMGSALEVLDRVFFKRRMAYTVSSMQEARALILKNGFEI